MTYLLGVSGERLFLDDLAWEEGCLSFHARATITEVNGFLTNLLGVEPKISMEPLLNSSGYSFGEVEAKYIRNGKLYVELSSGNIGLIDKIWREYIKLNN